MMQSRAMRVVIWVAALAALVVVLLAVAASLVHVDAYRPAIEAELRRSLGREVEIGHLRFSLLGGVTADRISIADDETFSRSPFLRAGSLEVGVKWLPLIFSHRLRIRSLTLAAPEFTLLRAPSGKWNFESLGASAGQTADAPGTGAKGSATLSGFSVERLTITRGRLVFGIARGVPMGVPGGASEGASKSAALSGAEGRSGHAALEGVSLAAKNVSYDAPFPLNVNAKTANGGAVTLNGTVGPTAPGDAGVAARAGRIVLHLKLAARSVPVEDAQEFLRVLGGTLPFKSTLLGGTAMADLAFDGPLERVVMQGALYAARVQIEGFDLGSRLAGIPALTGIQTGPETLIQALSSNLRVAPEGVRLDDLHITIPELGTLVGSGRIIAHDALDLRMRAKLVEPLARRKSIGGLGDLATISKDGFPFRIEGTTTFPVFGPDLEAVGGSPAGRSDPKAAAMLDEIFGRKRNKKD